MSGLSLLWGGKADADVAYHTRQFAPWSILPRRIDFGNSSYVCIAARAQGYVLDDRSARYSPDGKRIYDIGILLLILCLVSFAVVAVWSSR